MPDSSLSCSKEPERKRVASDIPSGQWFGGGVRLHGTVAFEGPDPPFLLLHDKERQPQGGYFTFRSMPSIIEHRRSPGEDQTTGRTAPRCPRNPDRPVRTRPAPAACLTEHRGGPPCPHNRWRNQRIVSCRMMQSLMWRWQTWAQQHRAAGLREVTLEGAGRRASWPAAMPDAVRGLRRTGREIRSRGPDRHGRWRP